MIPNLGGGGRFAAGHGEGPFGTVFGNDGDGDDDGYGDYQGAGSINPPCLSFERHIGRWWPREGAMRVAMMRVHGGPWSGIVLTCRRASTLVGEPGHQPSAHDETSAMFFGVFVCLRCHE